MSKEITINKKDYQLRLTARAFVNLEKRIGRNPLTIFMAEDSVPSLEDMILIFHAALRDEKISVDDCYDLYDTYCDEGGNFISFSNIIIDLFKDAGFFPEEVNTKNA